MCAWHLMGREVLVMTWSQSNMPPDVIEELHLQLAEYIQMQTLHQEVHEEHSGSCAMHHGPSHSLAHVDGVVPSSKASSPSASSPKAATAATAAASAPLLVGRTGPSAEAATTAASTAPTTNPKLRK